MGAHHDYSQFRGVAELLEFQGVSWLDEVTKSGVDGTDPTAQIVELEAALRARDQRVTELEAKLAALTSDGPNKGTQASVMSTFRSWDANHDGHISKEELAQTFKSIGS